MVYDIAIPTLLPVLISPSMYLQCGQFEVFESFEISLLDVSPPTLDTSGKKSVGVLMLVGGEWNIFDLSIYWEFHRPN